ncbi:MAG TPA: helix-turn-helix domain-containing protein [Candidatus Saccharibacteria bacterium]|nr:helix-turn-helix domain-containing protein [Candidatus Saccharibacteria bacterium]
MQTVGCLDQATQILGDKWTPRLLRFFINNDSVRFCQLQELAGDINPRTLSARLVKLEKSGIIIKRPLLGNRCEYELTTKGRDLLPILEHMNNWSEKYA